MIKGAGDLASGVGLRLQRAGFPVVMTETARPQAVRRRVAFAQAVFDGACQVEEVTAQLATADSALALLAQGVVPVIVDPQTRSIVHLQPYALVDAVMAKRNTGTRRSDATLVVALGPGFTADEDCHAVVETNRGHNLGRVLWRGSAEADTGLPGEVPGVGGRASRVLRAPASGFVQALAEIGEQLEDGQVLAVVRGSQGITSDVRAPFAGVLRGIIHPSVPVEAGMKIGDVDPRAERRHCFTVSDKSLAIGGGVLEAVLGAIKRS
jgi:xanthine dehydrogenase accessory factor